MNGQWRQGVWGVCAVLALLLGGCGTKSLSRAPVEDRGQVPTPSAQKDPRTATVKQPAGFENAGKSGYYTVKPGDTLIRIGLENGQSHQDIARWNALDNPNRIEVGQVLRIVPPVEAVARPVASASSSSAPLTAPLPSGAASAARTPVATASAPAPAASSPVQAATTDEDLAWIWPSQGPILAGFDEVKNKGVDIGGAAGDAVIAAADGKVVYAGAGLRGYGNLIILKHNNTYLSAYAHNQALLVKEDQAVKKGQRIADMGNSDADRVKLHFEVRRQGKPVDPLKYLPAR